MTSGRSSRTAALNVEQGDDEAWLVAPGPGARPSTILLVPARELAGIDGLGDRLGICSTSHSAHHGLDVGGGTRGPTVIGPMAEQPVID